MIETTSPKTARQQLAALAKALRVVDHQRREDDAGLALVAGSKGKIVPTSDGLLVQPGTTASPSLALQLMQVGLLDAAPGNYVLARMPTEAETQLLRDLLGLHREGKTRDTSVNADANGAPR